jgi:NIMA (never in mitosis gene a)-related kinase
MISEKSKRISVSDTIIGNIYYLAPEIVNKQYYSMKTDIWSLGVTLYYMCSLCLPFKGISNDEVAIRIILGKYDNLPAHYSKTLNDLVA